jgi:flagellar hook-associated protein 2
MGAITFTGLASGLDTSSLIDQLVSVERSAATSVSTRKSNLEAQKSVINSISSALSSLATAARALDLDSEVKPRAAAVSDSRVAVAASAGASPGVHEVRVQSLAAAQVTQSRSFSSTAAGVLAAGGVDITVAGTTKSITWTASDSLDAIATRINDANAGVAASVVRVADSSYRLVVTAKDTGIANAPAFVETGDTLGLADPANVKVAAANAQVTIDGIAITRSTNVISDAVTGLTFTLGSPHGAGDASSKVTVSLDQAALTDKLKKLVDAYNAVNNALHGQLDYTGTKKGENTLFGDSTLRGLQSALAAVASNTYGDSGLSAIGLSRDRSGTLTLDAAKLTEALGNDPGAVSKIFITNGFATAVTSLVDRYTRADGLLAAKTQSLNDRQKVLQTRIDRINANADELRARLEKQFSALEDAMSKLKSQSTYLSSLR